MTADTAIWARFCAAIVVNEDECWVWIGPQTTNGYGRLFFTRLRRHIRTHRFAYEVLVGPIPSHLVLDHLCRNRLCCNPDHLEAVTIAVNNARSPFWTGSRTHCPRNHPYDDVNTYVTPTGGRECRTCLLARKRANRAAARAARVAS